MAYRTLKDQIYVAGKPLDYRCTVNSSTDIYNISNAYVGLVVYSIAQEELYIVIEIDPILNKPTVYKPVLGTYGTAATYDVPSGG